MNKSCATCKNRLTLEKWDYSDVFHNGVPKQTEEGYACLVFAHEGICVHVVGEDPEKGMCECYMEMEVEHD